MTESENKYSREFVIFLYQQAALISFALMSRESFNLVASHFLATHGVEKFNVAKQKIKDKLSEKINGK